MKFNYLSVVLLFIIFVTSSCRVHDGLTRNENQHQTQVVLSEKNYQIIKYVEGEAHARYFLGMGGGSSKRGLIARARENMLKNAGLIGKSRAVINETVETQYKQSLFTTEVRYIVSAYIVEFYDPSKEEAPTTEKSVYVEPFQTETPVEITKGLTAGITFQQNDYNSNYEDMHTPGFHIGYSVEFSNPEVNHFYWGTHLNLAFLNTTTTYNNKPYSSEKSLGIEIPLLLGFKYPLGKNFQWYIKGGPSIGIILYDRDFTDYYSAEQRNYVGSVPSIGGELYSGFQFGKRWQIGVGHRWNIGYYEYDYTKFSLNYSF